MKNEPHALRARIANLREQIALEERLIVVLQRLQHLEKPPIVDGRH